MANDNFPDEDEFVEELKASMAEEMKKYTKGWVVDPVVGHKIWKAVRNSPYVHWQLDPSMRLDVETSSFGGPDAYYRRPSQTYETSSDWSEPMNMAAGMYMSGTPQLDYADGNVRGARLSGVAMTSHGARFTFEFDQQQGEDAHAFVRVPVQREKRDELVSKMEKIDDIEAFHENVKPIEERFQLNPEGSDIPEDFVHVHFRSDTVTKESEVLDIVHTAIDFISKSERATK